MPEEETSPLEARIQPSPLEAVGRVIKNVRGVIPDKNKLALITAGIGLVFLTAGGGPIQVATGGREVVSVQQSGSTEPTEQLTVPTKEMFGDLLTKEELEKTHIKIYQTPEVQLFLRQGVFNFPLFKDAASGKLDEVGIVLVNEETISWASSENFPEDAKRFFRSAYISTRFPTKEGRSDRIEQWRLDRQKLLETEKTQLEESLKRLERSKKATTDFLKLTSWGIEDAEEELLKIEARQEQIRQELKTLSDQMANLPQEESPEEIRDREARKEGLAQGIFLDGRIDAKPDLIREYPGIGRKVFIFFAVGDGAQPKPSESYPNPEELKKRAEQARKDLKDQSPDDARNLESYFGYRYYGAAHPGFDLRHEIEHYNPLLQQRRLEDRRQEEYRADTLAMESIEKAWGRFKKRGNTSGYPIVFVTPKGLTVTKQLGEAISSKKQQTA